MKRINSARRWNKTVSLVLCGVFLLLLLVGCAEKENNSSQETVTPERETATTENPVVTDQLSPTEELFLPEETSPTEELTMMLKINNTEISVLWENNESVEALKNLIREAPLTINMSMYGGFEQVGSLGTSLPRNDVQTTTEAGDIVLYSGNQIVVFYGSNSWSYTRLGHISNQNAEGLKALLGNGDVMITISLEEGR